MKVSRLALFLVLFATACGSPRGPRSPYLRVVHTDGRVYYADYRNLLISDAGGFLSFYDIVTGEKVRLPNGSYSSKEVPYAEIKGARETYMYNPSHPPRVEDLPADDPKN